MGAGRYGVYAKQIEVKSSEHAGKKYERDSQLRDAGVRRGEIVWVREQAEDRWKNQKQKTRSINASGLPFSLLAFSFHWFFSHYFTPHTRTAESSRIQCGRRASPTRRR